MSTPSSRVIVAIPARDEADRIGTCLHALATQSRQPDAVLLLLNNCTDVSATIATQLAAHLPYRLHIRSHDFPPHAAHAGNARRLAMRLAANLAGYDGTLLTTDADGVVPIQWIERNIQALSKADLVCGRVTLDVAEAAAIPAHLHADDARECELTEILDRIAATLDPDPADPWPRHTEAAGASLAVTVAAFARVGGIPALTSGEDRAFVQALARIDARIRHDPTIAVEVSGRFDGRAAGGMADTIRRRMRQQDEFADACLEPAIDTYRRIDFRRRVRRAWNGDVTEDLAVDLGLTDLDLRHMLRSSFFGAAWAAIEDASPFLIRRRVRFTELPRQIDYARQLLRQCAIPSVSRCST